MRAATRIEKDSLGEVAVPADALYGSQTARAVANFPISGVRFPSSFIAALATVKRAAAEVNKELGLLDPAIADAIATASQELRDGKWHEQFVVDIFQAGAGTSTHMNANEVIANRAIEMLGGKRGDYTRVNPNDQVNYGQSTNDVIPTTIRLAALSLLPALLEAMKQLVGAFDEKAKAFDGVLKSGRTHLQDAVPVRLGQEFGAYARAIESDAKRIAAAGEALKRLGIGGSAAGTGLNTHPEYHKRMVKRLSELTGLELRSGGNLFELMQSQADATHLSASLRTLALTLTRICNDLRLMASGPRTGFAEIGLPAVQPGSSIMPGKVNPALPEMLTMVCFHVIGADTCIAFCTQAGQLELNVMMPIMAHHLLFSLTVMTTGLRAFTNQCVRGITADEEMCRYWLDRNVIVATALNPHIGYMRAAELVKESLATGRPVRELAVAKGYLTEKEVRRILHPRRMTEPGIPGQTESATAPAEPASD